MKTDLILYELTNNSTDLLLGSRTSRVTRKKIHLPMDVAQKSRLTLESRSAECLLPHCTWWAQSSSTMSSNHNRTLRISHNSTDLQSNIMPPICLIRGGSIIAHGCLFSFFFFPFPLLQYSSIVERGKMPWMWWWVLLAKHLLTSDRLLFGGKKDSLVPSMVSLS